MRCATSSSCIAVSVLIRMFAGTLRTTSPFSMRLVATCTMGHVGNNILACPLPVFGWLCCALCDNAAKVVRMFAERKGGSEGAWWETEAGQRTSPLQPDDGHMAGRIGELRSTPLLHPHSNSILSSSLDHTVPSPTPLECASVSSSRQPLVSTCPAPPPPRATAHCIPFSPAIERQVPPTSTPQRPGA